MNTVDFMANTVSDFFHQISAKLDIKNKNIVFDVFPNEDIHRHRQFGFYGWSEIDGVDYGVANCILLRDIDLPEVNKLDKKELMNWAEMMAFAITKHLNEVIFQGQAPQPSEEYFELIGRPSKPKCPHCHKEI